MVIYAVAGALSFRTKESLEKEAMERLTGFDFDQQALFYYDLSPGNPDEENLHFLLKFQLSASVLLALLNWGMSFILVLMLASIVSMFCQD